VARKNLFAQKIDPLVQKAVVSYKRAFTKEQIVDKVLLVPDVSHLIVASYSLGRTWDLTLIVKQAVLDRVNAELRRKRKSPKLGVSLRVYENYGLGASGARRWQRFDVMNLAELQLCIDWRVQNITANMEVVAAYNDIKAMMLEGEYQTIGQALVV